MKSSEEMTQDVLRRMDEYQAEKKTRHARTVKTVAITVPALVLAVILVLAWAGIAVTRRGRTTTVDTIAQPPTASTAPESPVPSATPGEANGSTAAGIVNGPCRNMDGIICNATGDDAKRDDAGTSILAHSRASITWNGKEYHYARDWYPEVDSSTFTKDTLLGVVGDFTGEYGMNADDTEYAIDATDSVYSVKESADVLLVVRGEGKRTPTDWGMPGSGESVVLADGDWLDSMVRMYGGTTE